MTVAALISGVLYRAPGRRTSQSGKAFVRATIKVQSSTDSGSDFWSVLAFGDTSSAALLELQDGDRLAVQGALKLEIYNGKISRTLFADQVLPLRAKKKRKDKPEPATATRESSTAPFDDALPF